MNKVLRAGLGLLLAVALCGGAGATVPAPWPPVLAETATAALDDPQSALAPARRQAEAARGEERFWRWLAVARLEWALEMDDDQARSLAEAAQALVDVPPPATDATRWLRAAELRLAGLGADAPAQLPSLAALRAELPPGPAVLRCELLDAETWLLNEIGSLDEAWRLAEALQACSAETGWPFFAAQAAVIQGQIAAADRGNPEARTRALAHFDRAEAQVSDGGARYLHSLVVYAAAISLGELGQTHDAQAYAARALVISRSLGDQAGIAAALIELAASDIELGRPADALPRLDEAWRLLAGLGDGARPLRVQGLRLQAMVALQHPALAAELERAMRMDLSQELPRTRHDIVLAMAEAQAALGRHEAAYAGMQRARRLAEQARQLGRDTQVLLLQARYDTARRDAEIAQLRHRDDAAQLSLQAQAATQRALWGVLAALSVLLAAAATWGWRAWRSRRELADLALRDELTALPNRRAIEAYARAQLAQSQRLGLPYTLVLLDLDHFKQVNDRFGHPAGDALLQALARTVPQVLRAPDRLGRWGGEEFMLVLPGTRGDEIGGVFARLLAAFAVVDAAGLPSPHGVTFSMGGVEAGGGDSFDALLQRADERLYAAKGAGRATWR